MIRSIVALLRQGAWVPGLLLVVVAALGSWLAGRNALLVPFAADQVSLAAVFGWLVGLGVTAAVWSDTPWRVWRSPLNGHLVHLGALVVVSAAALAVGTVLQLITAQPLVLGWAGSIAVYLLAVSALPSPRLSWLPATLVMALSLMIDTDFPGPLSGLSVAAWYDGSGRLALVAIVPVIALAVAILVASMAIPRRR